MTPRAPRTSQQRRLVYTPLADLLPADNNPKLHVDLGASFDEFGYMEPVMIDERTGRLVGGHGRIESLQARQRAGKPPPDGVMVRGGRWCVPTIRGWSSRDDEHADAALVALNRYTELGGWNDRALAAMLEGIDNADDDLLTSAGWTSKELSKLLADLPDLPDDTDNPERRTTTPADQKPTITHTCPNCQHTWTTRK
jgi:hypothetical protein